MASLLIGSLPMASKSMVPISPNLSFSHSHSIAGTVTIAATPSSFSANSSSLPLSMTNYLNLKLTIAELYLISRVIFFKFLSDTFDSLLRERGQEDCQRQAIQSLLWECKFSVVEFSLFLNFVLFRYFSF